MKKLQELLTENGVEIDSELPNVLLLGILMNIVPFIPHLRHHLFYLYPSDEKRRPRRHELREEAAPSC